MATHFMSHPLIIFHPFSHTLYGIFSLWRFSATFFDHTPSSQRQRFTKNESYNLE